MRIKKILSQNRRDFRAIYECEFCSDSHEASGYDDRNFHENVIPEMVCSKCLKKADSNFKPLEPKYPDGMSV